jgi:hypothetical protein
MSRIDREDDCRPRLGPMRQSRMPPAKPQFYLTQVLRTMAIARSSPGPLKRGPDGIPARMIGRGAGIGRLLKIKSLNGPSGSRQVIVRARFVSGNSDLAASHLKYLRRDGTDRMGGPASLYDAEHDVVLPQEILQRMRDDEGHYRFMVAPADAAEYDDLRPLTRRLMHQAERDLGTKLDWVAADHSNTGHPHTHILLRGRDKDGGILTISHDYIYHGLKARAIDLVDHDLGPQQREPTAVGRVNAEADAVFCDTDRLLLAARNEDGLLRVDHRDSLMQSRLVQRLRVLKTMGLAAPVGSGLWQLAPAMEGILRQGAERQRQVRILEQVLTLRQISWRPDELVLSGFQPEAPQSITGCLLAQSLTSLSQARGYLVIAGVDGRYHFADLGLLRLSRLPPDCILELKRDAQMPAHGPMADPAGLPIAEDRPRWSVRLLSVWPLERQLDADAPTWLDQLLLRGDLPGRRDRGFGQELKTALAKRQRYLLQSGHARIDKGKFACSRALLDELRQKELKRLAARLGRDYVAEGLDYETGGLAMGDVDLAWGRFTIIADRTRFSLLPWQPRWELGLHRSLAGHPQSPEVA